MNKNSLFVAAALSLLVVGAAQAQAVMHDGALVDAAGRTVYTFDKDVINKSNCAGGCLATWPVFMAKPEAAAKGEFGIIEANGARQWTVNGKPLYYFAGDAKPGDRNGDGKGGVWHVVAAKPEVKAAVTAAPASSPDGKTVWILCFAFCKSAAYVVCSTDWRRLGCFNPRVLRSVHALRGFVNPASAWQAPPKESNHGPYIVELQPIPPLCGRARRVRLFLACLVAGHAALGALVRLAACGAGGADCG
jgi:predicted lipoprotein with Yx(FWY)xxD motif